MTEAPNPYAPPRADVTNAREPAVPDTPPLHRFTLPAPKSARWDLAIHPTVLELTPSDGQPARVFDHAAFVAQTSLGLFQARASLIIPKPPPAVVLPLTPEAKAALREWLAPSLREHMARALGQQRPISALLGVLWMVPVAHNVEPLPVAFGACWLAWVLAATLRPHRVLFLANAALWIGAAISVVAGVVRGTISPWWLTFLLFFWPMIAMRIRSYRFYGPT